MDAWKAYASAQVILRMLGAARSTSLTLAVIPLFYVSGWLGVVALIAIYSLVTRLANKDFDRLSGRGSGLHPDAVERAALHRPVPIIDPIERDEG